METQPKSLSDNRIGFVNLAQQVTSENVLDLVSSSVTMKKAGDVLFNGTADEPIYINDSQDKELESESDLLELPKTDSENVDFLGGTITVSCNSKLEAAKNETRNRSEFLESNEEQTSGSKGLAGNLGTFRETKDDATEGKEQKELIDDYLSSSLTSFEKKAKPLSPNDFLQNRESGDAYSDGNLFKESKTQKRPAPMLDSPERKRKRVDLNELKSDEDYARYLQEAFNREAGQSNLMKDDEELAMKLSGRYHLDDEFSGEATGLSNFIEEDEKLARKLCEEDNFKRDTGGETNWIKGDEELAKKIAEEDNFPRYSVLDEVLANTLQEELQNETKNPHLVDEDAVLAMQLNEQLNKESPKQIARIKPTVLSGRAPSTAFAPEWTEYSKRKPSATYTPMSANKISFQNQVSMKKTLYHFSRNERYRTFSVLKCFLDCINSYLFVIVSCY